MFRLLDTPPSSGAWNMALDEALMESVRGGGPPALRFYRWSPRCLSLGRNQPAMGRYDPEAIARLGLDVVRRPTGGRAVLHARELTYSVVAHHRRFGGLRESYLTINRALAAGLRRLGVPVDLQRAGERAPVPSTDPCFLSPTRGEIVLEGRKLVGSAQLREGGVLLQHGSLLLEDDQGLLAGLMPGSPRHLDAPAVLAHHLSPLPSWEDLTAALAAGWLEIVGDAPVPSSPSDGELESARIREVRHRDLEWIWRG